MKLDFHKGEERVHTVEFARYGDHSVHTNQRVVFLVASSQKEAAVKACEVLEDNTENWSTEQTTQLHCGSHSLDKCENRQFIDQVRDDVIIGPDVPV